MYISMSSITLGVFIPFFAIVVVLFSTNAPVHVMKSHGNCW